MRHIFILDENVFSSACLGKNSYDQNDYSSAHLILEIADGCHKIAWNDELRRKYAEKSDSLKRSARYDPLMKAHKIVFHLITAQSKNIQNENYLEIGPDLHDDRHIISLAVFTGGILVTMDTKLKEKLLKKNLIAKHDIKIVTPKEALVCAREECSSKK